MTHSANTRTPEARALTGKLPVFSPQSVARAMRSREDEKPRKPEPRPRRPVRSPGAPTIHIDLGTVLKGAVAVAEFLTRHAARKRAADKELEQDCLRLAAEYQGLVGVPDLLMRTSCDRAQAERCLDRLEKASMCRFLCHYQDEPLYVFPAFLPRMWECDYCASTYPVPASTSAATLCRCNGCGAMMTQKILA